MQLFAVCDMRTGREISSEKWESGKVYSTASGDMVRSKQERFIADLLTSEGISFEYERELSSYYGSCRYPDFTLFIDGEQYYWEHWGMVDDYSYRQDIAKRIKWYREHGYYNYLIQTWGGYNRNLRGQVLVELSKLKKRKRRKIGYKPVPDSHVDWKTGHERLTEKLEETVRQNMSQSSTAKKSEEQKVPELHRRQRPKKIYRPEKESSDGLNSQDSGQGTLGWGIILLAAVLMLFLFHAFFDSQQPHSPAAISKPPKSAWQKPESGKQLPAEKRPELTQDAQTGEPNKKNSERLYMGIRISLPDKTRLDEENRVRD